MTLERVHESSQIDGQRNSARDSVRKADAAESVEIETFDPSGKSIGLSRVEKIVKSEPEWRALLSPLAFDVTRKEGTERAFTGPYWNDHADGLYRCVCCDTALFDSKTKYDFRHRLAELLRADLET